MLVNIFQKGFNFSQDGPGNRLVYHLQGCNMHCPWCSNPEGISEKGSIMVTEGINDEICPKSAITSGMLDSVSARDARGCVCRHLTWGLNYHLSHTKLMISLMKQSEAGLCSFQTEG